TRRPRSRTVVALVAAGLLAATGLTTLTALPPSLTASAETIFNHAPAEGFADLVEKVMPSVISVEVRYAPVVNRNDQQRMQMPDLPPDSPFRQFFDQFGRQLPFPNQSPRGIAQGSGFIISADGYAVTNNHVVANAEEVTVKTSDGEELKADVIGTDPKTDLALIKIKSDKTFQFVKFAENDVRVGDWVVAVGNPFGLGGTVTTGIISARERDIGNGPYDDFLQIDAPINKGNSGGPAFNLQGEVIGINTAIFSPSGGSVGIGFAIPAATAKAIIEDLKQDGKVTRGWLGVQIQPVTADIAESVGLKNAKGAIVADVTPDSPALKAGLKTGDTVLKVRDHEVADPRDLAREVAKIAPGETVPVTIFRGGKEQTIDITIGTMPGDDQLASRNSDEQQSPARASLGLQLMPAEDGQGVLVTGVTPESPAAEKGLKPGDIILEVSGIQVDDPDALRAAIDKVAADGSKRVLLLVKSGERQRFVALPTQQS
ncbi:MAG: DegQ family serine endoprotease, partial [Parvibaculaceae bacterium]